MPRRTDDQRIAMYDAKTVPAQVSAKVLAQIPNMQAYYPAFVNDFVPKLEEVRESLNAAGIFPMFYGIYYAFSSRLWKLTKTSGGESAAMEAAALIALYVARGLDQAELQAIRTDVFNIAAPMAP